MQGKRLLVAISAWVHCCEAAREDMICDAEGENAMMQQWKVWIGGAVGLMGLLMLISCAATSSRESIGESSEDAAITAKVQSSFAADPLVSASAIGVQTTQGVVHLSGTVKSEQERFRAIQLVQGVAGVREIIVGNLVVQR
jgi:hyperosmotically inducible periplasmic protein